MKQFDLKPFDKVLVRDCKSEGWHIQFFQEFIGPSKFPYLCLGGWYKYCIPYNEETKHLVGKTDDYEEPYEPKDGDFVTYTYDDHDTFVAIYEGDDWYYVSLKIKGCLPDEMPRYKLLFNKRYVMRRPANEEEKQLLINALHKTGKDWDAEKKEIVDFIWMPKEGEEYWCVDFDQESAFVPFCYEWTSDSADNGIYQRGWVFKTQIEAEVKAKELNEKLFGKEK